MNWQELKLQEWNCGFDSTSRFGDQVENWKAEAPCERAVHAAAAGVRPNPTSESSLGSCVQQLAKRWSQEPHRKLAVVAVVGDKIDDRVAIVGCQAMKPVGRYRSQHPTPLVKTSCGVVQEAAELRGLHASGFKLASLATGNRQQVTIPWDTKASGKPRNDKKMEPHRCTWGNSDNYIQYHDAEWAASGRRSTTESRRREARFAAPSGRRRSPAV